MKIYTRTGDSGTTAIFGGPRVAKDDYRIEAYGTVDELNAVLGCIRGEIENTLERLASDEDAAAKTEQMQELDQRIVLVQHELFSIGAELATPKPDDFDLRVIGTSHIGRIEEWIDDSESRLAPLKQFILPGGSAVAGQVHLARAVCRRAERRVVTLAASVEPEAVISDSVIIYLNRLSDWLFVVSRDVNQVLGRLDQPWEKP